MTRGGHKTEQDFEVATAGPCQSLGDEAIMGKTYSDTVRAVSDVELVYISLETLSSRFPIILERLKVDIVARLKAREMRHANHVEVFADREEEEEEEHIGADGRSRIGGTATVKLMAVNKAAKRYFNKSGTPIFREGINFEAGMVPTLAVGEETRPLSDRSDHMSFVGVSTKRPSSTSSSSSSSAMLPSKFRPLFGASRVDQMYKKLWSEGCMTLDTLHSLRDAAVYGTIEGDGVVEHEAEEGGEWAGEHPSHRPLNMSPESKGATPLSARPHSASALPASYSSKIEGMSRLDLSMVPQLGGTPRRPQTARRAPTTPRDDVYAGVGLRGRLTARPATGRGGNSEGSGRARAGERGALQGTKALMAMRGEDRRPLSARVVQARDALVAPPRAVQIARGVVRGAAASAKAGRDGESRKKGAGGVGSWADDAHGFSSPWHQDDANGRQSDNGLSHMVCVCAFAFFLLAFSLLGCLFLGRFACGMQAYPVPPQLCTHASPLGLRAGRVALCADPSLPPSFRS